MQLLGENMQKQKHVKHAMVMPVHATTSHQVQNVHAGTAFMPIPQSLFLSIDIQNHDTSKSTQLSRARPAPASWRQTRCAVVQCSEYKHQLVI